jgi:hypothetical protein
MVTSCHTDSYLFIMAIIMIFLGVIHLLTNVLIPICIIVITNTTLIIRVIRERMSRNQVVGWHCHRKMTFQLWLLSSLYMTKPTFMKDEVSTLYFIFYFVPLLLPTVCLCVFSETFTYTKELFGRHIKNRISPIS